MENIITSETWHGMNEVQMSAMQSDVLEKWRGNSINQRRLMKIIEASASQEGKGLLSSSTPSFTVESDSDHEGGNVSADFFSKLEQEMAKVDGFVRLKGDEIRARLQKLQTEVSSAKASTSHEVLKQFQEKSDELASIFLELERFVNTNYATVHEILTYHDEMIPEVPCKSFYIMRLQEQAWVKGKYTDVMIQLSDINGMIRGDLKKPKKDSAPVKDTHTKRYWVKVDDVSRVKWEILRQLPVFQSRPNQDSQVVHSLYLDNRALELCHGRMGMERSSQEIRFRWTDSEYPTEKLVVERILQDSESSLRNVNTHRDEFNMKTKDAVAYINGDFDIAAAAEKLREKGNDSEADEFQKHAEEVATVMKSKVLGPTTSARFSRTVFRQPFDASVQIVVDTNILLTNECGMSAEQLLTPPKKAAPLERPNMRFPFAVMEVKTQVDAMDRVQFVQDMVKNGMVHEANLFSKHTHACVELLKGDMRGTPIWCSLPLYLQTQQHSTKSRASPAPGSSLALVQQKLAKMSSPVSPTLSSASDVTAPSQMAKGYAKLPQDIPMEQVTPMTTSKPAPSAAPAVPPPGPAPFVNPKEKPPQKIEPKVFFANERTFLSWLNMAVTLSGIAMGITSLSEGGMVTIVSGVCLMLVAALFLIYALVIFHWRAGMIRRRSGGTFDDRFGPTILALVLLLGLIGMCVFKLAMPSA